MQSKINHVCVTAISVVLCVWLLPALAGSDKEATPDPWAPSALSWVNGREPLKAKRVPGT